MRIGKREREARKRHRRAVIYDGAKGAWFKLGRKKYSISLMHFRSYVGGRERKVQANTCAGATP